MCHRYTYRANPEEIAISFYVDLLMDYPLPDQPKQDFYPLSTAPVIRWNADAEWELTAMEWGLLPSWWKPSAKSGSRKTFQRKTFNARSETAHEKPSFRSAFKRRRCLIPATSFYEGGENFWLRDSEIMLFAGLWESWTDGTDTVDSFTILTTDANGLIYEYHPTRKRQPVILPDQESQELWMSPDIVERTPFDDAGLLIPVPSEVMDHARAESS